MMAPNNDPFYCGATAQCRDAEWFAKCWDEIQLNGRVHLRRVHYIFASVEKIKLNGKPYQNTGEDWEWLEAASKYARYLGLVDARQIEDHRNPSPILIDVDEDSWLRTYDPEVAFPRLNDDCIPGIRAEFRDYDVSIENLFAPRVRGYDYWEQRQPCHIEILCEKSTMNDILEPLARQYNCDIQTSLGFQTISSVVDLLKRAVASKRSTRILYISDNDPAGEHIPHTVARHIEYWREKHSPELDIALKPVVLTDDQVVQYALPPIPIKKTDKRGGDFKRRKGREAVELDALEALHPGELRRIVTTEIERLQDPEFERKFWDAERQARDVIEAQWSDAIADMKDEIDVVSKKLTEITDRYAEESCQLRERYKDDTDPLRDQIETIRQAVRNKIEDFTPDLPPLPEPEIEGDDPNEWLYHSGRPYEEQLEYYKRAKAGENGNAGNGGGRQHE